MNVSRYVCQFTRLGRRTLVEFVEKDKEEERGGGGVPWFEAHEGFR